MLFPTCHIFLQSWSRIKCTFVNGSNFDPDVLFSNRTPLPECARFANNLASKYPQTVAGRKRHQNSVVPEKIASNNRVVHVQCAEWQRPASTSAHQCRRLHQIIVSSVAWSSVDFTVDAHLPSSKVCGPVIPKANIPNRTLALKYLEHVTWLFLSPVQGNFHYWQTRRGESVNRQI